ncbi:alpha/beta fold hydrolase [Nocardia sp. NPDC056100]|uniref:alpha/beta fold hydrolase n=1 Tax=Nocardia sp. NPDC056100 TaxID=3345712 RepID=UPI0035DFC20A
MWNERMVRGDIDSFVAWAGEAGGRTLLVVHGGPDWDHSYLREPLGSMAGARRLLLPDLRGCGRSTRGLGAAALTPDAVVGDLLAVLDAFDVDRADVLGFSFGGLLAQRLAVAAPTRVRSLIVASSSVLPVPENAFEGWPLREQLRAAEHAVWADDSLSGAARTRAAAVAGARANLWRATAIAEYVDRVERIRFSADWDCARASALWRSPRLTDPVARLTATGIAILLVHGRYDMIFPSWLATEAAARIPTARAEILDRAGHMAHIDRPRQWLGAISEFL